MSDETKTIDLTCTFCAEQFASVAGNMDLKAAVASEFVNDYLNEATEQHIAAYHPEDTPTIMLTLDDGSSHYFEPGAA